MIIEKFNEKHINDAINLFLSNYDEERQAVTELPEIGDLLDTGVFKYFAGEGIGVAAVENDRLVGFLCAFGPWEGMFDSYEGMGVFSPIQAHGAVRENRSKIYQDMYEAYAEELASRNIMGLGIAMFAHDQAGKAGLVEYGFGMRCKDQIRTINPKGEIINKDVIFEELGLDSFPLLSDMRYELHCHLKKSPCFMAGTKEEFEDWHKKVLEGDRRTFVARKAGEIIAYLDVAQDGENFITEADFIANIQGAYCKPEHRGRRIYEDLLNYVMKVLAEEGYTLLGVDHESYNPTANRFWGKHFNEYTNSLVRKIELWSVGK